MSLPAPAPPAVPAPARKAWALRLRVVSGLLFVPLLIVLARAGGWAFLAFVALQVGLGVTEFYGMMRRKGLAPHVLAGTLGSLLLLWTAYHPLELPRELLVTVGLMLVLALALIRPHVRAAENLAVTAFGVMYVGWLSAHLVLLRELPWQAGTGYLEGASFVLLAFFVTWSCDTGAYGVGRLWGRTRLWARISPRKTVEGSVGGFVCAVLAAVIARAWFARYLGLRDAIVLGALVGVSAQLGDLVESLLKRDAEHGDSSDLIPGHGGVLDRFDSLYFAAPVVFYYLRYVVFGVP